MKKKELTLQDLFNKMDTLYSDMINNFKTINIKLGSLLSELQPDDEKHSEPEISNTAYVILTENGCFVGGEPATQYNGEDIYRPYLCVAYFKEARDIIHKECGYELLALHCLQSSTNGEWAKTGNPVPDRDGTCSWVRAVYKNKEDKVVSSLWAFRDDFGSASLCASGCTSICGYGVRNSADLRSGLLGSVAQ